MKKCMQIQNQPRKSLSGLAEWRSAMFCMTILKNFPHNTRKGLSKGNKCQYERIDEGISEFGEISLKKKKN